MKLNFLLMSFLVVALSACQQDVQSQNTPLSKSTLLAKKHTVKSHVPVAMQYEFLNVPELNKPLEIKLEFKVGISTENLQVIYRAANNGLTIESAQSQYAFNNLPAGATETITVNVIPVQTGAQAIYISATMNIDGVMQSRAFQVPVNVGTANQLKANTNPALNPAPKGMTHIPSQNVISMPASEPKN